MKKILVSLALCMFYGCLNAQYKWTATWATAVESPISASDMPDMSLSNNSLRQTIHVSIGGEKLRLRLSNEKSEHPVEIKSVYIADVKTEDEIMAYTATYLTFNGKHSVTIEPGKAVYTDIASYKLKALQCLSVTIYYGQTPPEATTHRGSRTTSFLMEGESKPELAYATVEKIEHWYNIASLEVETPESTRCIACLGNSITDGHSTTTDAQNRWTDVMAEGLGGNVGVINLGIGGNCVIRGGLSDPASERFNRDILSQQGVTDVIVFQGVNDIGGIKDDGIQTGNTLISFYRLFARKCHEKGINVYGGTITPFKNSFYYNPTREKVRRKVNNWIRTTEVYDGCIDFDKAISDPENPEAMREEWQADWLHPNVAGYKTMGEYATEWFISEKKYAESRLSTKNNE